MVSHPEIPTARAKTANPVFLDIGSNPHLLPAMKQYFDKRQRLRFTDNPPPRALENTKFVDGSSDKSHPWLYQSALRRKRGLRLATKSIARRRLLSPFEIRMPQWSAKVLPEFHHEPNQEKWNPHCFPAPIGVNYCAGDYVMEAFFGSLTVPRLRSVQ